MPGPILYVPDSILKSLWKYCNITLSRLECGQSYLGRVSWGTKEHTHTHKHTHTTEENQECAFPMGVAPGEDEYSR